MILINPPIVLDNTVISRFGLIDRFDLLLDRYQNQLIIPTNVIVEAIKISKLEVYIKNALDDNQIEEFAMDFCNTYDELKIYTNLRKRFDDGECAVMAIAQINQCTVASDDLRATRKYCEVNNINHIGSLGILYDCYTNDLLNFTQADSLLKRMINETKYRSPVSDFQSVQDWFEKGIGIRLY